MDGGFTLTHSTSESVFDFNLPSAAILLGAPTRFDPLFPLKLHYSLKPSSEINPPHRLGKFI